MLGTSNTDARVKKANKQNDLRLIINYNKLKLSILFFFLLVFRLLSGKLN